ncbi:sensor histidine kinase [Gulosibacter molinativorax]|uniref:Sensor histidine kinase MtrB n=2 Tax=Gulosibacter molinativorax TaxID=256821 RepID=A0ABT7CBN7_9MICO|nr:sensor histidine kinase [Gulosibacter molinativorax]
MSSEDADLNKSESLPGKWWRPSGFTANIRYLWGTSLPFRTTLIAVVLTTATVVVVAVVMGNTIARDLYTSRADQVLQEADHAVNTAQAAFDQGLETDELAITALRTQALDAALAQAPNASGFAFYRADNSAESDTVLQDIASGTVPQDLVSDEIRAALQADPQTTVYQSVSLDSEDGRPEPALVVGSTVTVPTAGTYELYLVYSMQSSQDTLDFVQRTLTISMAILVLMVGAIVGGIMRAVIRPIRVAAQTSRKLAAGHLEERIPEQGQDDIGTLARSFNDMADNLQRQIEQLEDLSQVQQRFVSDVSHELRTPLTTIRLAAGIVYARKDELEPTVARSAELLQDQIERFELLLADLLEISRYDAGAVQLLRKPNDLTLLAEDVIEGMTQVAADQGEALILRATSTHIEAEFDERRVNRVIRNLVANAIEHGEGKPILVSVDGNATAVAISVRDYGVGMTDEQQTQVFSRFWRADPSRKRTMGGSGLGLAISQEDAQLHNGRLELWSAPELGSNFRLTLPRHVDEPIVSSPLPLVPDDAGAETYTVEAADRRPEKFDEKSLETQPIELPGLGMSEDDHWEYLAGADPETGALPTNATHKESDDAGGAQAMPATGDDK